MENLDSVENRTTSLDSRDLKAFFEQVPLKQLKDLIYGAASGRVMRAHAFNIGLLWSRILTQLETVINQEYGFSVTLALLNDAISVRGASQVLDNESVLEIMLDLIVKSLLSTD